MKIQDSLQNLPLASPELKPAKAEKGFSDLLQNAIEEVNQLQTEADHSIRSLLTGESQDMHQTILAVQRADTSFKVMMQVRNKIIEAYKELSRTSI
jgi:flagellar hook-basal body complex protein FliE